MIITEADYRTAAHPIVVERVWRRNAYYVAQVIDGFHDVQFHGLPIAQARSIAAQLERLETVADQKRFIVEWFANNAEVAP
jgi:hypothetical protein